MRISDWSSDVCSSDLDLAGGATVGAGPLARQVLHAGNERRDANAAADPDLVRAVVVEREAAVGPLDLQRLPDGEPVAQSAGVVAQLADAEGDDWIRGVPTGGDGVGVRAFRSEEHTSELQSLMRISYAVFCLKKKKTQ